MLQGFGYLGLHRLDRNPHFPGNFLISLPFLPTFAINLPTFVRKGTNSFFNQSFSSSISTEVSAARAYPYSSPPSMGTVSFSSRKAFRQRLRADWKR